jgi:hypothetical protein
VVAGWWPRRGGPLGHVFDLAPTTRTPCPHRGQSVNAPRGAGRGAWLPRQVSCPDPNGCATCTSSYTAQLLPSHRGPAVERGFIPGRRAPLFLQRRGPLTRLYRAGIRTVQLNSHDAFLIAPPASSAPGWETAGAPVGPSGHNADWRCLRYLDVGNSPATTASCHERRRGDRGLWRVDHPTGRSLGARGSQSVRFTGDRERVKALNAHGGADTALVRALPDVPGPPQGRWWKPDRLGGISTRTHPRPSTR